MPPGSQERSLPRLPGTTMWLCGALALFRGFEEPTCARPNALSGFQVPLLVAKSTIRSQAGVSCRCPPTLLVAWNTDGAGWSSRLRLLLGPSHDEIFHYSQPRELPPYLWAPPDLPPHKKEAGDPSGRGPLSVQTIPSSDLLGGALSVLSGALWKVHPESTQNSTAEFVIINIR